MNKIMRNALSELKAEYAAMPNEEFVKHIDAYEDEDIYAVVENLFCDGVDSYLFNSQSMEIELCKDLMNVFMQSEAKSSYGIYSNTFPVNKSSLCSYSSWSDSLPWAA